MPSPPVISVTASWDMERPEPAVRGPRGQWQERKWKQQVQFEREEEGSGAGRDDFELCDSVTLFIGSEGRARRQREDEMGAGRYTAMRANC